MKKKFSENFQRISFICLLSMELEPITITLKTKEQKKQKDIINLDGYIKVKIDQLKYFYGSWIKCVSKKEYKTGFLNKIYNEKIYLKNTFESENLIEFYQHEYKFYVKNNTQQYYAMQEIENEREYLKNKTNQLKKDKKDFEKNKRIFEKIQRKFYQLFSDGKVSILV